MNLVAALQRREWIGLSPGGVSGIWDSGVDIAEKPRLRPYGVRVRRFGGGYSRKAGSQLTYLLTPSRIY